MNDRLSNQKHEKRAISKAPYFGGATHRGAIGKTNEDRYEFYRVGPGEQNDWHGAPDSSIYIVAVADGVTSKAAGADASALAIKSVGESLDRIASATDATDMLNHAFLAASSAVQQAVLHNPELKGMSTTLVVAAIVGSRLYVAHLGDSRAYLVRKGQLHRLTLDHTGVQMAQDSGVLTAEQARTHPNRHLIVRHIAADSAHEVDHLIIKPGTDNGPDAREMLPHLELYHDDIVILCTDGVSDRLSDRDIANTMTTHRHHPEKATKRLVKHALDLGEPDNITAAAITIRQESFAVATVQRATEQFSSTLRLRFLLLLLPLLILLGGLGLLWTNPALLSAWSPQQFAFASSEDVLEKDVLEKDVLEKDVLEKDALASNQESSTQLITNRNVSTSESEPATVQPTEVPATEAATATATRIAQRAETSERAIGVTATPETNAGNQNSGRVTPTPTPQMLETAIPPTSTSIPALIPTLTPTLVPTLNPTATSTPRPPANPPTSQSSEPSNISAVAFVASPTQARVAPTANAPTSITATGGSFAPRTLPQQPAAQVPVNAETAAATATSTVAPSALSLLPPSAPAQSAARTSLLLEDDWNVLLLSPTEDALRKRQRFHWTSNFELPPTLLFELIFWPVGTSPLTNGFSPSGAGTNTDISIDLDEFSNHNPDLLQLNQRYEWGVGLVETNNTRNRVFVFEESKSFLYSARSRPPSAISGE